MVKKVVFALFLFVFLLHAMSAAKTCGEFYDTFDDCVNNVGDEGTCCGFYDGCEVIGNECIFTGEYFLNQFCEDLIGSEWDSCIHNVGNAETCCNYYEENGDCYWDKVNKECYVTQKCFSNGVVDCNQYDVGCSECFQEIYGNYPSYWTNSEICSECGDQCNWDDLEGCILNYPGGQEDYCNANAACEWDGEDCLESCYSFLDEGTCVNAEGCAWQIEISKNKWSPWFDNDNPGVESIDGDSELLSFLKINYIGICSNPSLIDCKTLDGQDWRDTGENLTCSTSVGLNCLNSDNVDGCSDYKVRFYCGDVSYVCEDTDDGLDYFYSGSVLYNGESYNDYCSNEDVLVEYFCGGEGYNSTSVNCPHGCSGGECISSTEAELLGDGEHISYCSNSNNCILYFGDEVDTKVDGEEFNISISDIEYEKVELEINEDISDFLIEKENLDLGDDLFLEIKDIYYSAKNDNDSRIIFSLGLSMNCSDTDGGIDYYKQGQCCEGTSCKLDSCEGSFLTEYYCLGDSQKSMGLSCPNGCENGVCNFASQHNSSNINDTALLKYVLLFVAVTLIFFFIIIRKRRR